MAAMKWDSAAQAFADPQNVPKRYDPNSGAFVDTTGKAFDHDAEAWVEKWSPNRVLHLYDNGIFNVISQGSARNLAYGPNGYVTQSGSRPLLATIKYNADNIETVQNSCGYGTLFFDVPINLTKYGALEIMSKTTYNYYNPIIGFTQQIKDNFVISASVSYLGTSQQNVLDISRLTGSYYLFFGLGRGYDECTNVLKVYKLTLKA